MQRREVSVTGGRGVARIVRTGCCFVSKRTPPRTEAGQRFVRDEETTTSSGREVLGAALHYGFEIDTTVVDSSGQRWAVTRAGAHSQYGEYSPTPLARAPNQKFENIC